MDSDSDFYRSWILANGWSEAIGLGSTFALGSMAAPLLERQPSPASVLAGALGAVLAGTLLEGVLIGLAQGRVLCRRLPELAPGVWIRATAIGAGLAWLAGMFPSTVTALASLDPDSAPVGEPSVALQYLLAVVLGLVAGPILGVAQWTVLRRHCAQAGRWLWANAVAWAAGMLVIFVGMDLMPWEGNPVVLASAVYGLCGVTGLVVGAIHGRVLVSLVETRTT